MVKKHPPKVIVRIHPRSAAAFKDPVFPDIVVKYSRQDTLLRIIGLATKAMKEQGIGYFDRGVFFDNLIKAYDAAPVALGRERVIEAMKLWVILKATD